MSTFPTLASGSMKVASALSGEAIAMYPTALSFGYATRVVRFLGDQEQRYMVHNELFSCTLQFHQVNGYDTGILRTFFRSMAGMATSVDLTRVFDITIGGVNYKYCVFDQDDFTPETDRAESFSFELKIKQLRPN